MARDYREPKTGDWCLISNVHDGDVACLRCERADANGGPRIAWLSDGSMWAVETGAPLYRRWVGHHLWTADLGMVVDEYHRRIDKVVDLDTWAQMLAVLLDSVVTPSEGLYTLLDGIDAEGASLPSDLRAEIAAVLADARAKGWRRL